LRFHHLQRLQALEIKTSLRRDWVDGTHLAERLEPSTAVELSIVADELAAISDGESVDADNGVLGGSNGPSPGDGVTIVPQVQGLDSDLRLTSLTLGRVECGLAGEGGRTKRNTSHEVNGVRDINEVLIEGGVGDILLVATAGRDEAAIGRLVVGELQQGDEAIDKG